MSMKKAIAHKKEYRKEYHGAKAIDKMCRNHGGCPWCEENRIFKNKQKEKISEEKLNQYKMEEE